MVQVLRVQVMDTRYWVQVPTLTWDCCVTFAGRSLTLSEPDFLICNMGDTAFIIWLSLRLKYWLLYKVCRTEAET